MDRLTKSAHFLSINIRFSLEKMAHLYIKEINKLHGVPSSIISDRDLVSPLDFGIAHKKPWEQKLSSFRLITLKLMDNQKGLSNL